MERMEYEQGVIEQMGFVSYFLVTWDFMNYSREQGIPIGPGPANTGFHVEGVLTHPGDSHSFVETMPILAMPFAAPWGSLVAGVDRTRLVQPRYVIPIHDWFLSEDGKAFMYRLAEMGLANDETELVHIEDFETAELQV